MIDACGDPAGEGRGVPGAPRGRSLRNPQSVGRRLGQVLAGLGFKALATTSSGLAFTLGRADGTVTLDEIATHVAVVDRGDRPAGLGGPRERLRRRARGRRAGRSPPPRRRAPSAGRSRTTTATTASSTSANGRSSASRPPPRPPGRSTFPFTLTARAENHLRGNPDLDDTVARLRAFEEAGADVLYAPGLLSAEEIKTVCDAVSKPVNVLAFATPRAELRRDRRGRRAARQCRQRAHLGGHERRSRRPSGSSTTATSRASATPAASRSGS